MKRFITVLSSLLVLPAFAEVAPVYYDEIVEYTDDMIDAEDVNAGEAETETAAKQNVVQRTNINRSTAASRAVSSGTNASSRTNSSSRAIASSPRNTASSNRGTTARTAKTTNVVSRAASSRASRQNVTSRNAQGTRATVARVGTYNNSVMPVVNRGISTSSSQLNDSGNALYLSRGSTNRRATARVSSATATAPTPTTVITQEDISTTTNNLSALAELTDYCKAQYAACMDNYCNVLDDNQGRCSCSKNLKNYEKTETALAQATEDFQDVVQKIKYIGLTGSQIESLFTETEAELAMKSNSDSSQLKNSLDALKKKLVDVSTPNASSYATTSGISLDLNGLLSADFTSGFDLNSFLGNTGINTNSVSNQRGEQLYKTAANRCKTSVLNSCVAQGIDANVITNSYDLEIDKQCVAYERSLNEANTEMKNNVTNAKNILQQARLLLAQNRNSYDLRGCVAAIDSCMQDEYVCGSDYELCLDPTGKYLANGEIVKGGTPGVSGGQARTDTQLCSETCKTCGHGSDHQGCGDITFQTSDWNAECCSCNVYGNSCETIDNWISGGMYNLYSTWNYDHIEISGSTVDMSRTTKNAWSAGSQENLGGYIDDALSVWGKSYTSLKDSSTTDNMALYLLQKIGYIDKDDKVHGMCASVMKQCQDYTFNTKKTNKTYIPSNEVVRQYLVNTLAKIKVKQDEILTDYAEGCRSDVQSCLSTNGYEESNTSSTASKTAVNACAYEITTCMSVGGYHVKDGVKLTLRAMTDWVASVLQTCPAGYYLYDDGIGDGTLLPGTNGYKTECKPCPTVPVFTKDEGSDPTAADYPYVNNGNDFVLTESTGGRVARCSCPSGYTAYTIKDVSTAYEMRWACIPTTSNTNP